MIDEGDLAQITIQIITALTAIISVLIGNYASSWLAYRRTTREKLWDTRREAYGYILSRLSSVKSTCATMDEYMREDTARFWVGDTHVKYDEMISEKMREVWQRLSDDYLILSDEFVDCLENGFKTRDGDERRDPYLGHEAFAKNLRNVYPRLLAIAKGEIHR